MELCGLCGEKPNAARSVPTPLYINSQFLILNSQFKKTMENKSLWNKILNILITVLTAIATTFGTTSCMGM